MKAAQTEYSITMRPDSASVMTAMAIALGLPVVPRHDGERAMKNGVQLRSHTIPRSEREVRKSKAKLVRASRKRNRR